MTVKLQPQIQHDFFADPVDEVGFEPRRNRADDEDDQQQDGDLVEQGDVVRHED